MTEDEKKTYQEFEFSEDGNILINGTPKTAKKLQLKCIKQIMRFLINTL